MGANKKLRFACTALSLLAVFGFWFFRGDRAPLTQREVALRVLGEHLKKNLKPIVVLLISNPFSQTSGRPPEVYSFQRASEAGLRAGLGESAAVKIAFPKLRPEATRDPKSVYVDPKTKTPLSFLIAENAFEELLRENADCQVAVSLIGLPLNAGGREFWTNNTAPRFGLLFPDLRMIGDLESVRRSLQSGKIAAIVVARPGVASGEPAGKDYQAEFEKRFLLVTPENFEALMPLLVP